MNTRRLWILFFAAVSIFTLVSGCASMSRAKPLTLSPYRRNIIIREDASVMIEDEVIDFRIFREELVKRVFVDKDRIVLHVHENVSEKVFEAVFNKLKEFGFKNIESKLYRDTR